MRKGYALVRGRAGARGDARDKLALDAVLREELGLFAAAAEHGRIAALEPDDRAAASGRGGRIQHRTVRRVLVRRVVADGPADIDEARRARDHCKHAPADQPVVQDHVGAAQQVGRPHGEEALIAGSGPD